MNSSQRFKLKGFTLLEMVLVLFLVGLMASTTLMLTEGVEDQAKYDITRQRLEMIRKAIAGDTSRTVNGSPELSGFVADMGRLPGCLAELLELGAEKLPATSPKTYASPCNPLLTVSAWDVALNTGIGFGWRGPYLQVLPERNGDLRFRDGYGNSGNSSNPDAKNSGWVFSSSAGTISLTSQGFKVSDATDDIVVSQLVVPADWQVQLPATVNVTVKNQSAGNLPVADLNIILRVYLSNLSDSIEGDDATNDYLTFSATSPAVAGSSKTLTFTLDSTPNIAIGKRAYALVCDGVPATAGTLDDYVIFDGDCNVGNAVQTTSTIRSFSVLPRQSLTLNLDWIIP